MMGGVCLCEPLWLVSPKYNKVLKFETPHHKYFENIGNTVKHLEIVREMYFYCSGMGNKNTVGGWLKSVGGRLKSMNKSINKFRQKNATVFVQYVVLIPSSTRLRLYRLLSIYFRLLCRDLLSWKFKCICSGGGEILVDADRVLLFFLMDKLIFKEHVIFGVLVLLTSVFQITDVSSCHFWCCRLDGTNVVYSEPIASQLTTRTKSFLIGMVHLYSLILKLYKIATLAKWSTVRNLHNNTLMICM